MRDSSELDAQLAFGIGKPLATDAARHAVVEAVRATADSLNTSLEQMKLVEDMRRTLREIRDVNKLNSN